MKAQVLPQQTFPFLLGAFVMLVTTPSLVVPLCITPMYEGTELGIRRASWSLTGCPMRTPVRV
jgi:hypothetical protein